MRFTVSSSALSSKLNMLAKVIGSKNSLPILDCFLFQVANGEMSITASDSDNVIKSTLALTDHDGEGEFCVPNRVILDALKELPEQPLHFDVDAAGEAVAIKIVYQNGLYNFTGQNAEEYPRTQSMNDACTTVSLPTEMLINNISRSLFATANDELRPVMNGIYFDLTADALAIVASDGHKLVRSKNFTIKSESPSAFNLPKKPASLLKNILSKDGDDAIIKFDDRSAEIQFTDGVMRCRLIDGRYPNYNSVIPNNPNEVTVDRRGLQSALRRVLPFASESSQLIRFHIESGRFEVSSEDIDFSTSAKEQLSCEYNGSPISIGFKGSSLMEILSNLTSDNIIIQLADPSRAGIIVPAEQPENEDILMLIMPMLLND
ncbi:DNA polymerase III subunit beta [Prevotella copri]|jgi:DNA polymerase-3 subunit beta|uniref:Beta sliding clamp n=1 Tax=Segatella copri TaxID=165179 RepID=A0A3E5EB99_9BACT|nr:DNA polymerase III subunit beta [Segatella copri]MCP9551592.1 DNA polymerase III subunit beta [Segatella copri]MCP9573272.1 DNA polymerase III subunit beta [Segatella copri]MCP9575130.1 DNA polymerase III subunit beta [Segatella copri]MCP9577783.1 DNA polymerase III subunit beta [Segatella copri]MCP9581006.1 DNA polymerase III subunit beta [Segatella copri]